MSAYVPVYRISLVQDGSVKLAERPMIRTPDDAGRFFLEFYRQHHAGLDREVVAVACVNVRGRVIACETVSVGCLTQSLVSPREVFKLAIARSAAGILVAHNHPSCDTTPSEEDLRITKRLRAAGVLLGIEMLDHVIVGDGGWTSLSDRGLL